MKYITHIVIASAIFFVGWSFGGGQQDQLQNQTERPGDKTEAVQLMLDFGEGDIRTFSAILEDGDSMFDILIDVSEKEGFVVDYRDFGGDLGVLINGIDGVENDFANNSVWQYWVNNDYAEIGASSYIMQPRDVVMWKRTRGQTEG